MDDGAGSKDLLERHLEGWINYVIKRHADGHNETIPSKVRDEFQRTVRASIDYHNWMARAAAKEANSNDYNRSLVAYHLLVRDIYRTFL